MPRDQSMIQRLIQRLILGAALVLSGPAACEREVDQASSPAPVTATLYVAPVAASHPWVMAMVTQTSITRPHGVDARLEGLVGVGGERTPDPILEGETREDLQSWLDTYEAQHPRPPELLPIWERDPFGPDHRVRARLYFIAHERGFVADAEARASVERHEHGPSVHVRFGPAQTRDLEALTAVFMGRRLAVALDDEALMLPVIAQPITGGQLELATQTSSSPELTAPALLKRLTR